MGSNGLSALDDDDTPVDVLSDDAYREEWAARRYALDDGEAIVRNEERMMDVDILW